MQNHLWNWNLGYLQQEAANSGESALQEHAGRKITCEEIRLVGGGSEATMKQDPNIRDVVESRPKGRDWDPAKTSRPRPHRKIWDSRTENLWIMPIFFYKFSKNIVATTKLQFFRISGIFLPALVVSYLQIQQAKNTLIFKSFTKPCCCSTQSLKWMYLWSRPQDLKLSRLRLEK